MTCFPFELRENLLERRTLSDVLFYFKSQQSSGRYDRADRCLPFEGGFRKGCVDVHGSWYDATGDYGKHLSHLSLFHLFQSTADAAGRLGPAGNVPAAHRT